MAEITWTPANVQLLAGEIKWGISASNSIDAGQPIHLIGDENPSNAGQLGQSNIGSNVVRSHAIVGIALNQAKSDQPVAYVAAGRVSYGVELETGRCYFVGDFGGSIKNAMASTDPVTLVGIAVSTSILRLGIHASGVERA